MFTLDKTTIFIDRATNSFMNHCSNLEYKNTLSTLKYKIKINPRLKIKAGVAKMLTNKSTMTKLFLLELSPHVLFRMTEEEQFQTVSHELAHLLDFSIRNKSAHDDFWQNIHKLMGGDAKRCHTISMVGLRNKVKRFVVTDTIINKEYVLTPRNYHKKAFKSITLGNTENPGRYTVKQIETTC